MRYTQKRRRSNGASRFSKRRRIFRVRRRSRRTTGYTTRSERPTNAFKFRGKLLSKRRWRNALFRTTRFMPHYRSIRSRVALITTPDNVTDTSVDYYQIMDPLGDVAFWKRGAFNQGVQDPNWGTLPTWAVSLSADPPGQEPIECVVRGGRMWMCMSSNINDVISARVQLAWLKKQTRAQNVPTGEVNTAKQWLDIISTTALPHPASWTFQDAPDYHMYFTKPVIDKTVLLLPGEASTVVAKMPIAKVDCSEHRRGSGYQPFWFVYTIQRSTNTAGAATITATFGYNMSFTVTDTVS